MQKIIFATTTKNQHIRSKIKTHTHALAENDYILKSRNNNANHNSVLEKKSWLPQKYHADDSAEMKWWFPEMDVYPYIGMTKGETLSNNAEN